MPVFLPPEILARVVHWLYQSGDKITATRLLMSHKNGELVGYCKLLEQPVVFKITVKTEYKIGLHEQYTDITIDWGDDCWDDYVGKIPAIRHKYKQDGLYRIRIYARKLLGLRELNDVIEFNTLGNVITSTEAMFHNSNVNIPLQLDTSMVINMSHMFANSDFNKKIQMDTSNVINMSYMFAMAVNFNQPVRFNTSKCRDMICMFYKADEFNQEVNFDTAECETMAYMFSYALNFNKQVNFNTSKCTNMACMFENAYNFNQEVNFDTSKCTDMSWMFYNAISFNQVINFKMNSVRVIEMLRGATSFNKEHLKSDISHLDTRIF